MSFYEFFHFEKYDAGKKFVKRLEDRGARAERTAQLSAQLRCRQEKNDDNELFIAREAFVRRQLRQLAG